MYRISAISTEAQVVKCGRPTLQTPCQKGRARNGFESSALTKYSDILLYEKDPRSEERWYLTVLLYVCLPIYANFTQLDGNRRNYWKDIARENACFQPICLIFLCYDSTITSILFVRPCQGFCNGGPRQSRMTPRAHL